ncbi:MAG: hypothetical protein Q6363_007250 [Candidatus Njordarchaeota archaeon]
MSEYFEIRTSVPEKMQIKNISKELLELPKMERLEKTSEIVNTLLKDPEILAAQLATNHMIVKYLQYNDHGRSHAIITTRNAIKILILLRDSLEPNLVSSGAGTFDEAASVVAIAAFIHDLGNMVHRAFHYGFSTIVANRIVWRYIHKFWKDEPRKKKWLIYSHIMNAIFSHDDDVFAYTVEGSVVKVADGCDMAAGRSRMPYNIGKVDIHSVSALSIREINIKRGLRKPIRIEVDMVDAAGIFQVEEILMKKVNTSILPDYIEIETFVDGKKVKLSKPSFPIG